MAEKTIHTLYVLSGKDAHLRDEARRRLIARIIGDADPQVCVCVFEADAELADILDELRTVPLLAPHRVVIVRQAEAFLSAHREALENYLRQPAASGTLVLMVDSWDQRTRLAKRLDEFGELIDCTSPEGADLLKWIRAAFADAGKQIAPAAVNLLAETVGPDLAAQRSEIDKLLTYAADREKITLEDASAIVTAQASPEAFAVTNAVTAGDAAAALKSLDQAMQTRGAEFALLGQLAWHVRRALQVVQLLASGQPMRSALRAGKVFYAQREFEAMLRRRSPRKLQADMRRVLRADLAMKTGTDARSAMQQLVIGLCD
jgi:DNA polymerase-3 subunit delta